MANNLPLGAAFILTGTFISAASQILLKLSTRKSYANKWREYFNFYVIAAYALFVLSTICGVMALRYIPVTLNAALGTSGQIFVPVMSFLILHEKISRRKLCGMALIVLGILIFSV